MIRDITIGQYYPADSPLHRMDARVKITVSILNITVPVISFLKWPRFPKRRNVYFIRVNNLRPLN